MGERCEVFLEREVYYPGETINGRVECHFTTETKVKGIRVKFKGMANVKWKEGRSYHSEEEIYFNMESELLLSETIFPPGVYNYPFTFSLPNQLPSSMNEECGSIKYTVQAKIDRPWAVDYKFKKTFTIYSYNNLNAMSELKIPTEIKKEKRPHCYFYECGPIIITVYLPMSGFVPSQMVSFTAKVNNKSDINIKEIHFKLVQGFTFHVRANSKTTNSLVGQEYAIIDSSLAPKCEKSWDLELRIPCGMFNGTLQFCNLIKVFWELRGEIILPFAYKNIQISVPFTLGDVPLM